MSDAFATFLLQGLVPLASVLSGAACSICAIIINRNKDQALADLQIRHEESLAKLRNDQETFVTGLKNQHEESLARLRNDQETYITELKNQHEVEKDSTSARRLQRFEFEKSMETERIAVFIRMIPFLIEAHRGDLSHKNDLLALALEMLSRSEYDTPLYQRAESLVATLSDDDSHADWLYVASDFAKAIYYRPETESALSAPLSGQGS